MNTYPESTEKMNLNTVLLGHDCFQESLEQFVAEFETRLNRVSGRECTGWEEDCAGAYGRGGDDFKIDANPDPEGWEWY